MADMIQKIEAVEYAGGQSMYRANTVVQGGFNHGKTVKEIGEHRPEGPGDVWMYNVVFLDGSATRVFNHTGVHFSKPMPAAPKLALPEKKKLIV